MVQDLDISISDEVDVEPPATSVDAAEWFFPRDCIRAYPQQTIKSGEEGAGRVPAFMPVFGTWRKPVLSCGSIIEHKRARHR